jgi:hypothetical protein
MYPQLPPNPAWIFEYTMVLNANSLLTAHISSHLRTSCVAVEVLRIAPITYMITTALRFNAPRQQLLQQDQEIRTATFIRKNAYMPWFREHHGHKSLPQRLPTIALKQYVQPHAAQAQAPGLQPPKVPLLQLALRSSAQAKYGRLQRRNQRRQRQL